MLNYYHNDNLPVGEKLEKSMFLEEIIRLIRSDDRIALAVILFAIFGTPIIGEMICRFFGVGLQ